MLNNAERLRQEKIVARIRREEIARKASARKLQDSGWTTSQWAGMTSENRLIRCDHFQKNGNKARLDYLREEVRKAKKAQKPTSLVRVEKK